MAQATVRLRGEKLTRARLLRLLTVDLAAGEIGVTRGALSRAEAGGPVRLETARAVVEYYGLDPSDVILFDEKVA